MYIMLKHRIYRIRRYITEHFFGTSICELFQPSGMLFERIDKTCVIEVNSIARSNRKELSQQIQMGSETFLLSTVLMLSCPYCSLYDVSYEVSFWIYNVFMASDKIFFLSWMKH